MLNIVSSTQIDRKERSFSWNGKEYQFNFAYDNILRLFKLIDDNSIDKMAKFELEFEMLIGSGLDIPLDKMAEAVNYAVSLIQESPYQSLNSNPVKTFDYEQDSEAIYASFLQQYGIDLIEEKGKLDYFKFRALFTNLDPNTPFQRIVHIRTENPSKHVNDQEYLNQLNLQQQTFALKKSKEEIETEKQAQMEAAFGDL
ncbi:Gp15 family bacteriophage protein [Lactobacillus amylolyticus]|uniref:Gp15 family bacteriophage protein n=1 Tax=Lactobacillus amylolyticus TaxID=83683 RepID=UPI00249310C2|nr:Gp15 family bacteriophage protein [Lactobacillus amylolyticus]